jgi:hypothetical protein
MVVSHRVYMFDAKHFPKAGHYFVNEYAAEISSYASRQADGADHCKKATGYCLCGLFLDWKQPNKTRHLIHNRNDVAVSACCDLKGSKDICTKNLPASSRALHADDLAFVRVKTSFADGARLTGEYVLLYVAIHACPFVLRGLEDC